MDFAKFGPIERKEMGRINKISAVNSLGEQRGHLAHATLYGHYLLLN